MARFDVNVRAIVLATSADKGASGNIPGWEIYDFDALKRDEDHNVVEARIRCDQNVTVEADNEEEAIKLAKADATDIAVDGFVIEDVDLWVDEGIDVTLSEPVSEPSTPSA